MRLKKIVYRKSIAAKQKPITWVKNAVLVYGIIWALLEPLMAIIPGANASFSGWDRYLIMILVSSLIGFFLIARPNEVMFHTQNATIIITFDDLFIQPGIKVIPVSRYMYEIEVVPTSLQATVIAKFMSSEEGIQGIARYQSALDDALNSIPSKSKTRSQETGAEKLYPLGTSALISNANEDYLLFAVTKTELQRHIPENNCNTHKLWISLRSMWSAARIEAREKDVNIPLIGSGITGIKLSPQRILELNLLALLSATVEDGRITPGTTRIVLHSNYFEQIDLEQIRRAWEIPN